VARVALWPFTALVRPLLSLTYWELLQSLVPAAGLAALTYAWVIHADAASADATVATEQLHERAKRLPKPVVRPQPFALSPMGRPEVALLWKNLILLGRYASVGTLARVLPLVFIAVLLAREIGGGAITVGALIVTAYAVLIGPMSMRLDLRHDLPRLRVIRTWPVSGWSLVAGELAAPAAALTVLAWLALGVALAASGALEDQSLTFLQRTFVALALGALAPGLIGVQLVVQNAAVLVLPGWIPTGPNRPRGIEATGQNLLVFAGTSLAFALALLPALLIGGLLAALASLVIGVGAAVVGAGAALAVLAAEIAAAVVLLGRLLERTDPEQVEVPE
jgi:ABC-2 type transport system permease protein